MPLRWSGFSWFSSDSKNLDRTLMRKVPMVRSLADRAFQRRSRCRRSRRSRRGRSRGSLKKTASKRRPRKKQSGLRMRWRRLSRVASAPVSLFYSPFSISPSLFSSVVSTHFRTFECFSISFSFRSQLLREAWEARFFSYISLAWFSGSAIWISAIRETPAFSIFNYRYTARMWGFTYRKNISKRADSLQVSGRLEEIRIPVHGSQDTDFSQWFHSFSNWIPSDFRQ